MSLFNDFYNYFITLFTPTDSVLINNNVDLICSIFSIACVVLAMTLCVLIVVWFLRFINKIIGG